MAKNPQVFDDIAICIVASKTTFAMLPTHDKRFRPETRPIPGAQANRGLPVALSRDSRAAADAVTAEAVRAGGVEPKPATGPGLMYGRIVSDPDGHRFEPVLMATDEGGTGALAGGRKRRGGGWPSAPATGAVPHLVGG